MSEAISSMVNGRRQARRMMRRSARPLIIAGGLTALALSLSGCEQGIGGGARSTPTVAIKIDASADAVQAGVAPADVEVAGYGTLRGRVVVTGTPPTLPPTIQQSQIKSTDAAACVYEEIPHHNNFRVGPGGELENVFVYLPAVPPGAKGTGEPPEPVKFDQKTCTFIPHCLVARTGQTILVLNSDPILHNTHTFPTRNTAFNQGVRPGESDGVPLVYQRAEKGPVRVVCDIHPWMGAYHLPLDHSYAAASAADGTFEIPDLPAGTHEFTIWHEVAGTVNSRYEVTIEPDATAEVEITIEAGTFASFRGERPKQVILSAIP